MAREVASEVTPPPRGGGGALGWLLRRTDVRPEERRALAWSATLFFLLLFGYMLLRPVRDMMGARAGWHRVPSLARAVLIAMLLLQPVFGWIVARWPRRAFLPWIYGAFALQLVGFAAWALLSPPGDLGFAEAWFVWLSVFNLFVVSVFWGFMADTWRPEQAARLYGAIGVGGTLGAALGGLAFRPLREALAALDPTAGSRGSLAGLCLVGATALLAAVFAVRRVAGAAAAFADRDGERRADERVGGGVLDGLLRVARSPYLAGIALLVVSV
jgi:ATP:ADP antiporter, AAA family